jgi:hypothetical protein
MGTKIFFKQIWLNMDDKNKNLGSFFIKITLNLKYFRVKNFTKINDISFRFRHKLGTKMIFQKKP